jgi:hypothetical protein
LEEPGATDAVGFDVPRFFVRAALLTFLSVAPCGCSGRSPADGESLGVECSSAHPSYTTDVAPILARSCGGGDECHSVPTRESMLGTSLGEDNCDLAAVDVFPGSLDKSYLMHKLTGVGMCPSTSTMPLGSMLGQDDIQTFADWICEGAPAN